MRYALLLAALAGCGGDLPGPDEVVLGFPIYYQSHGYQDAREYLTACLNFHANTKDRATLRFYAEGQRLSRACGYNPKFKVAGCSPVGMKTALILDKTSMWETAVCHELTHILYAPVAFDYDHQDPIWKRLGEAGLNGGPRPEDL